jgi:hypothetical protein
MTPASAPSLRGRTLRSFLLLGAQKAIAIVVTAGGTIALARLLTPEVFGLYAILSFVITLGVRFSELGLGAALIQRRDLDAADGLGAAFTATLGLALLLGAAIAAAAPLVARWPGVPADVTAPLRGLALLVVLSALRMPAAVLLERRLAYLPLTIAETADTVAFNVVAVAAALAGAGLWSFVAGAVAARAVNVAIVWSVTPWRPYLRLRWRELAPVLKFGILFQGSILINIVGDSVVPLFVTAASGVAAVGLLNWATTLAFMPLQVVSIAGRVLFPALSSLQTDAPRFAGAAPGRRRARRPADLRRGVGPGGPGRPVLLPVRDHRRHLDDSRPRPLQPRAPRPRVPPEPGGRRPGVGHDGSAGAMDRIRGFRGRERRPGVRLHFLHDAEPPPPRSDPDRARGARAVDREPRERCDPRRARRRMDSRPAVADPQRRVRGRRVRRAGRPRRGLGLASRVHRRLADGAPGMTP